MGGVPPDQNPPFAKRGKWLRIGCRLRQNLRNFDFCERNDFYNLAHIGSSVTPEVASSSLVVPARLYSPSLPKTGF